MRASPPEIDIDDATFSSPPSAKRSASPAPETVSTTRRQRRPPGRLPDWRNLLVALAAPAIFFATLELLLAVLGVEPVLYEEDPYVGFASTVPLFVEETRSDGSALLATAANKRRLFNDQSFAKKKPRGVYRIFCVGGSTTHGRPYDDATSFCGWLRELLPAVDDSRRWEVVNAGGVSYASYRSALLMEELARHEPDLFVIYSGHNEFLEERTYSGIIATPPAVRGLAALASRTRLYSVLGRALRSLRASDAAPAEGRSELAGEVRTRLDASVGPDAYERNDALAAQVLDHYRFNLARMTDIARSAGARAVLITPGSNLRHSSPFKSQHTEGLSTVDLERWEEHWEQGTRGEPAAALAAVDAALAIDERHAGAHFLRGTLLFDLERYADAKTAFERAREEDVCPLRAPRRASEIVRQVAADRKVPLVDFARFIETRAPHGITGDESFLDHVHPTIEVHLQLALEILATLREEGVVSARATWGEPTVADVRRRVEAGLDTTAHGRALLNLSKVLGWAGKLEDAGRLATRAAATAPELPEAHYQAGLTAQLAGRLDEAVGHYRRSLELAPRAATTHGNLAAALEARGQTLQAILHYRQAIDLLGPGESAYKTQLEETLVKLGATPDG
jgi:tetratricopeptide (TPR) repeat protein